MNHQVPPRLLSFLNNVSIELPTFKPPLHVWASGLIVFQGVKRSEKEDAWNEGVVDA